MREWLRTMRIEKNLSMKDMGAKLGISESYYSMIESGDRQKKMDMVLASGIATIFGLSITEIIKMENNKTSV